MIRILSVKLLSVFFVTAIGYTLPASAIPDQEFQVIKQALIKFTKKTDISRNDIIKSPVPGLYQVNLGPRVFYITKDGRYFFNGAVLDLKQGKNLTAEAAGSVRAKVIGKLDEKDMIIFSPDKSKVKHTITVFTDVECYYCQKFHSQIQDYLNLGIRVRYLPWPRSRINSPSYFKSVSVWCAKDRHKALTDAKKKKPVPMKLCKNPVARSMQLGRDMGVNGTPTIVFENGHVVPGYVPANGLIKILEKNKVTAK